MQNAGDFALALGELMGAAMFLTTIVLAAVIITSTGGICPGRKAREAEIAAARHAGELIVSEAGNTPGGASDSLSGGEATAFTASGGGGTSQGKGAMLKTVLIGTSSCDVDAVPFLRDVGIFFVALLAIFLMIAIPDEDGKHTVTLLESIILILVYVVYVVVVSVSFLYRCYIACESESSSVRSSLCSVFFSLHAPQTSLTDSRSSSRRTSRSTRSRCVLIYRYI